MLYFEQPDEIIGNRDDNLYIQRLLKANAKGKTQIITEKSGGHTAAHPALWEAYLSWLR